jgi:UDP-N-acetylmuramoyl-tripeptide--D-alanyl-D-alanine ligase
MFTLADLLEGTGGALVAGRGTAELRAISIDSRTTVAGDLFVAFRGERQDGHQYVADALSRGAAGALVERTPEGEDWGVTTESGPPIVRCANTGEALEQLARWWRRKHNVTVVGVTGSVGKTSTKEIIASLLSQRWSVLRSQANYNTEIGLPITLMQLEPNQRHAVLEMGMHDIGDIERLASIAEPRVGVVTNVHPVHLERLGTIERIAQAKSELVQALPPDGLAVLNADDERVRAMAALARGSTVTYGLSERADIRASDIASQGLRGTRFTVHHRGSSRSAMLSMPGAHFVHAALAGIAVATWLGMGFEEATDGLAFVEATVEGRLHPVEGTNGITLLDDAYNASPASTIAALNVLAETNGRRVAVLGDMFELGSFEREGHRSVGHRAGEVVDWLVTVGSRAREIASEARAAGLAAASIDSFDDADAALAALHSGLREGDVVLVKASHGMRLDRIVDRLRAGPPKRATQDVAS